MVEDEDSFDSLFADEEEVDENQTNNNSFKDSLSGDLSSNTNRIKVDTSVWKILIVDDEHDIHAAIKLALGGFVFENRKISFLDAYSGEEAKQILHENSDIALILLDVVMETSHAGLDFVGYIRNELKNHFIRVVLWTGQPGQAPKKDVILQYEINDYKTKTDLTDDTIFTTVLASIRSYNAIMIIESFRQDLEQKVIERTATIEAQKKKITDSIDYAQKIQSSILPSPELIQEIFPNSFVYFKPKDVVSGDFYWMHKASEKIIYLVASDCTGHGVPGAFMSMIGSTLLNEIVASKKIEEPSEILKELNQGVIDALTKQSRSEEAQDDGMDISLCKINLEQQTITLALANHTSLIAKNNSVEIIEGEAASIGGFFSMMRTPEYKQITLPIEKGMRLYMYSDGVQDQFGGELNKKFTLNRLKNTIFEAQSLNMKEQGKSIDNALTEWQADFDQLDDILVLGIEF